MKLKCSIEELLEKRKEAITVRIEFSLSDPAWDAFTCAFAYCWDNAIDAGGKIYPQIFQIFAPIQQFSDAGSTDAIIVYRCTAESDWINLIKNAVISPHK